MLPFIQRFFLCPCPGTAAVHRKKDEGWTDEERQLQSGKLDLEQYEKDRNVKLAFYCVTDQELDEEGRKRIQWTPIKVWSVAPNPGQHVYLKEKPGEKGRRRGVGRTGSRQGNNIFAILPGTNPCVVLGALAHGTKRPAGIGRPELR
jgi:hypothetical protein